MTEIPTEALEAAARAAIMEVLDHFVIYESGSEDGPSDSEVADALLEAAAPYLIAEGRRQRDAELTLAEREATPGEQLPEVPGWMYVPGSVPLDTESHVVELERQLRAKIADEIREQSLRVAARAEALAGTAPGAADSHPFMLGCEWAALIAVEGPVAEADDLAGRYDIARAVIDETPALMARYERELRAKIAAEIRAGTAPGKQMPNNMRHAPWWSSLSGPYPAGFAEWAARIAEGPDAAGPRVWAMPQIPATVKRLQDADGTIWTRHYSNDGSWQHPDGEPDDLSGVPEDELITSFGPLNEVVDHA